MGHSPFGQINIAVLKIVLHKPMTEELSVEVNLKRSVPSVRKWQKSEIMFFFKSIFGTLLKEIPQKFLHHMKMKSKMSYLGKKISILPKKMTEKMEVEVDVKSGGKKRQKYFFLNAFYDHFQKCQTEFFCL